MPNKRLDSDGQKNAPAGQAQRWAVTGSYPNMHRGFRVNGTEYDEYTNRAEELAAADCYCAALWWAAKALESPVQSRKARTVFEKALPNVVVTALRIAPQNESELVKSRFSARDFTLKEAESIADVVLRIFYSDLVFKTSRGLLEAGKESASSRSRSDLGEAMRFAAAVCDYEVSGEMAKQIRWEPILSPENLAHLNSSILREREALVTMFQVNDESMLRGVCPHLHDLYASMHPELAACFRNIAIYGLDMEFVEFRNRMERTFINNAVEFMWMRSARRPI